MNNLPIKSIINSNHYSHYSNYCNDCKNMFGSAVINNRKYNASPSTSPQKNILNKISNFFCFCTNSNPNRSGEPVNSAKSLETQKSQGKHTQHNKPDFKNPKESIIKNPPSDEIYKKAGNTIRNHFGEYKERCMNYNANKLREFCETSEIGRKITSLGDLNVGDVFVVANAENTQKGWNKHGFIGCVESKDPLTAIVFELGDWGEDNKIEVGDHKYHNDDIIDLEKRNEDPFSSGESLQKFTELGLSKLNYFTEKGRVFKINLTESDVRTAFIKATKTKENPHAGAYHSPYYNCNTLVHDTLKIAFGKFGKK